MRTCLHNILGQSLENVLFLNVKSCLSTPNLRQTWFVHSMFKYVPAPLLKACSILLDMRYVSKTLSLFYWHLLEYFFESSNSNTCSIRHVQLHFFIFSLQARFLLGTKLLKWMLVKTLLLKSTLFLSKEHLQRDKNLISWGPRFSFAVWLTVCTALQ